MGEQQKGTDEDVFTRPFADVLREIRKGSAHDELSEGLRALGDAVHATGKGGSISFTIKVEPINKKNSDAFNVSDKVVLKLPEAERKTTVFFPDKYGNPLRTDPNQLQFDTLREVPPGPREADAAERAAGEAVSE